MKQVTAEETANLLRCAADHIDRVGLCKHAYYKGITDASPYYWDISAEELLRLGKEDFKDAPCCAFGALYACATSEAQVDHAARVAGETSHYQIDTLDDWNDAPSRRKGDVVRLFRKAADELEQE